MTGSSSKPRRACGGSPLARFLFALVLALTGCSSPEERLAEHLEAADGYVEEGAYREALLELRLALQLDPQRSETSLRIADLYATLGEGDDAFFYYQEVHRLDPRSIEARLRMAQLLQLSDPERARSLLEELVEEDPTRADVHGELSNAALSAGDVDGALREALLAVELDPTSVGPHLHLGLVNTARIRALRLQGEEIPEQLYEDTAAAFRRAREAIDEDTPSASRIRLWTGLASLQGRWPGRRAQVRQVFEEGLASLADLPAQARADLAENAVEIARQLKDRPLLLFALERRVEFAPGDYRAWRELAHLVRASGGDSLEVVARLTAARPDDAAAHSLYAQHLALAGRDEEAAAYLEERIGDIGQGADGLLSALAVVQLERDRADAAREVVQRLEREYPDSSQTSYARARLAIHEGRSAEAVEWLTRWAEKEESPRAYRLLSEQELQRGNAGEALSAAERALELARMRGLKLRPFLCTKGIALSRSGSYETAASTLRLARRSAGAIGEICDLEYARVLYRTDRPAAARRALEPLLEGDAHPDAVLLFVRNERGRASERSLEVLDEALDRHPGNSRLLLMRIRIHLDDGEPDQALELARSAVEAEPDRAELHLALARTLVSVGEVEEALEVLEVATVRWPSVPGTTRLLANLLSRLGRLDEARERFEALHRKGELPLGSQLALARLRIRAGEQEAGMELFEAVLAVDPDNAEAANDLAYQLAKRGEDLSRATELAQAARAAVPEAAGIADTLGFVYLQRGLDEAALVQFDAALELAEEHNLAWATASYHRGVALQRLERREEALSAVERALATGAEFPEAEEARELLRQLAVPETSAGPS